MVAGAGGGAATGTPDTRLGDQVGEAIIAAFYDREVDFKAGCQYAADLGVRLAGWLLACLADKQARTTAGYSVSSETGLADWTASNVSFVMIPRCSPG